MSELVCICPSVRDFVMKADQFEVTLDRQYKGQLSKAINVTLFQSIVVLTNLYIDLVVGLDYLTVLKAFLDQGCV